jgi:murein DD-endopeptidase MepM/ murein hydrolase activator NlpD
MISPVPTRITAGYGVRLGRSGRPTFHAGLDLLGRRGDPVRAVAAGTVAAAVPDDAPRSAQTGGYGNVVAVDHGDGWWTVYAHLDRIAVQPGQRVAEGALVGTVGNSSNRRFRGMGPHLHFEVRDASQVAPFPGLYRRYNVDPRPWLEARGVRFDARGTVLG